MSTRTITVFSVSSSLRSDASSFGFSLVFGTHHLMVRPAYPAMATQGAMLASWSTFEMMISDLGGNGPKLMERLRKSWVVDDPKTMLSGEALMYFAAAA